MTINDKKILIVVNGTPHPNVGASMVVFFHFINGLRQAGFKILNLLLLQPDNSSEKGLAEYRSLMDEGDDFQILVQHAPYFARNHRWEVSFNHVATEPARQQVENFHPDVTVCLGFSTAWATYGWDVGRRVVWLGDLEFETFFYHSIYSWKERDIRFRDMALAIWYSFLWKRRYRHNLKPDDLLLVASKSSEKTIAQLGLQASYLPYPWPVTGKAVGPIERPSKPTFLFFGSLVGLGSRSAFHTMIKDIYPGLVRTWGGQGFDILIGGRGQLPSWVENDITAKPEIRYIGFIEDLDAVIGACHAVLIPIDVPVGNRSRILTALSKRAVVVAHRNTALGNPDLVDGESCYIAETGDEFVDRLRRTFEKPEEAREIAERGYNVYNTHFEPSKAVSSFIKLIQSQLPLATGRNEAHPL